MQTLLKSAVVLCSAVTFLMVSGCSIPPPAHCRFETEPVTRSIALEDATLVEANLRNGSLRIEGWDKPNVEMTAKVWAKAIFPGSAKRLATETKVDLVKAQDKVVVKYEPAHSMIDTEHVGVDIVVRVPRQAGAEARMQGDISAANMSGIMKLQSNCGKLELHDITAPVDCRSNCGDIRLTRIRGPIAARANCGDVRIADSQGPIDCRANCGSVRVTNAAGSWDGQTVQAQANCGDVAVSLAIAKPSTVTAP